MVFLFLLDCVTLPVLVDTSLVTKAYMYHQLLAMFPNIFNWFAKCIFPTSWFSVETASAGINCYKRNFTI